MKKSLCYLNFLTDPSIVESRYIIENFLTVSIDKSH